MNQELISIWHYWIFTTHPQATYLAQRLMDRRTRILLPMTDRLLEPALRTDTDTKSKLQYAKYQQAAYYNRNAKDLAVLEEGSVVRMKPYSPNVTWKRGVITKRLDERSYQVDIDSGTYHRNRSHLRMTNESDPLNDAYSSTTNASEALCSRPTSNE